MAPPTETRPQYFNSHPHKEDDAFKELGMDVDATFQLTSPQGG